MKTRDTTTCAIAFEAALVDWPIRSPSSVSTGMPCISSLHQQHASHDSDSLLLDLHSMYHINADNSIKMANGQKPKIYVTDLLPLPVRGF